MIRCFASHKHIVLQELLHTTIQTVFPKAPTIDDISTWQIIIQVINRSLSPIAYCLFMEAPVVSPPLAWAPLFRGEVLKTYPGKPHLSGPPYVNKINGPYARVSLVQDTANKHRPHTKMPIHFTVVCFSLAWLRP